MLLRRTTSAIALFGLTATLLAAVPASALVTGTLDPTFGSGGVARIDLSGPSVDVANGLSDGDGSLMVGAANDRFALASPNSARGTLVVDFDAPAMAYAASGASTYDQVAVGRAGDDFALARLSRDGSPIAGFGTQGRVRTSFGRPAVARGVVLEGDDSVVVGTVGTGADADLVLARYDVHGLLAPAFGAGGNVVADLSGGNDAAYAVRRESRLSSGRFVLVGRAGGAVLVARFLPDGTWDPTFGTAGRVLLDITAGDDIGFGLSVRDEGSLLVSGTAGAGAFVARLSKDGVPDPTFGIGGVALVDLGPGGALNSVSISAKSGPQGLQETIVAGGTLVTPAGHDGVVVRLDGAGQLVAGFGSGGRAVVDFGGPVDRGTGIQIAGASNGDGILAILSGDDGADMRSATVDDSGHVVAGSSKTVDFSISSENGQDMVVQPDGAVVVVGSGDPGLVVLRLRPDGRLDPTFGRNGVVVESGGTGTAVALQADGKILVGGSRGPMAQGVFRFLADGRLDLAFGESIGFARVEDVDRVAVGAVAERPDGHIVVGTSDVSILSPSGRVESQVRVGSNLGVVGLAVEPGGAVVAVNRRVNGEMVTGPGSIRILADGTRDPDFGGYGNSMPAGVVRLADGRFVIAAEIVTERTPGGVPSKIDLALSALTPGGQRDDTFGNPTPGPQVQLDLGRYDHATDISLTPDGKILVVLSVGDENAVPRLGLARFLADGRLDTTFASKGTWMAAQPFITPAIAVAPGGRILAAATLGYANDNKDIAVVAMTPTPVAAGAPLAWGFGGLGQLGVGAAPVVAIAGGTHHTLEVTATGTVRASGWNLTGQLGDGTTVDSAVPVTVAGLTGVVAVAAGTYHSLALKADGSVWAWGWNHFGQLGDGTTVDRLTPVRVAGLTQITSIAAGAHHNLALRADGTAFAWGWNGLGQLGNNTNLTYSTVDQATPVPVFSSDPITALAAGSYHSLFLYANGEIRTAGWNHFGQLGHADVNALAPSGVLGSGMNAGRFVAIAGGGLHSLAIRADGTVWAWGYNQLGELGDGSTTDRHAPVQVTGVANAAFVAGGAYHSLVLGRNGDVKAWGWNGYGQLGTAAGSDNRAPALVTSVPAGTVVRGVAGGALHSLAY